MEAKERGEKYKITKLRRNIEMDEYDLLHWRRSFEEREALIRDISWYLICFTLSLSLSLLEIFYHIIFNISMLARAPSGPSWSGCLI
jgi:hypothetical protein